MSVLRKQLDEPRPTRLLVPPHNPTAAPRQSKCEGLTDCDAFSALMSSRKANEAWKEADMAGDRSFRPTKAKWWTEMHRSTRTRTFRPLYESFVDLAGRSDLLFRGHS
ncbi:hypothetical protein EDB83DRAFT_2362714 [Lactarius deliciosus]|nr:hypothetical protein EDB83DRAFT_2362714 [Lactarius deliciosus]